MFTPTTFIKPFDNSSKFIVLLKSNGSRFAIVNVCQLKKVSIEGKKIVIFQEGHQNITLVFASVIAAVEAQGLLQDAIDLLKPNCEIPIEFTPEGISIISLTYAAYKALAASNDLVETGWYNITDTANALGYGLNRVFRVQSLSTNDSTPVGQATNNLAVVELNTVDDRVEYYHEVINNIKTTAKSFIYLTGNNDNITANNNSVITTEDSSFITAVDDSNLTTTDCTFIKASHDSNVVIEDSSNVTLIGIQEDVSSFGEFTDITVDQSNTLGKAGIEEKDDVDTEFALTAYQNTITQVFDDIAADIEVTLVNPFLQANAVFEFHVKSITGEITVIDNDSSAELLVINSGGENSVFIFKYNKTTNAFEYQSPNAVALKTVVLEVDSNNQTLFEDAFIPAPLLPASLAVFINGMRVFNFSTASSDFIYDPQDFPLSTTDHLYIEYT